MSTSARQHGAKGATSLPTIVIASAVVVVLAVAGALVATHDSAFHVDAANARTTTEGTSAGHHRASPPARPLTVLSVSPAAGASNVAWNAAVTVRYSAPLSTATPLPTLSPAVAGGWDRVSASTLVFRPVGNYVPWSTETVTVPGGSRSTSGRTLGVPVVSHFTVAGASELRLQELLAELGYLPVAFTPQPGAAPSAAATASTTPAASTAPVPAVPAATGTTVVGAPAPAATLDVEPADADEIPLEALPGTFSWRFSNIPPTLAAEWSAGGANEVTTGAVMAFESAHGLADDGIAGVAVWRSLLEAAAAHQLDTAPYDYVYVTETLPEYVTVWRDGVNVFTTLANTGIAQAPTEAGTWPVYARYTVTTMKGTEPNGQTYSDPGIPWVSYFHGGDALHGYLRSQYGFPQSLGCVEMPYTSAGTVYPYTPIGTLVTVE